jgi:holin-like protein
MKATAGSAAVVVAFVLLAIACEMLLAALHVPFSSAVLGLLVLLGVLLARRRIDPPVDGAAHVLLTWFPLLFVPSAVGAMAYANVLAHSWLGILVALLVSTPLGVAVAATVGTRIARRLGTDS